MCEPYFSTNQFDNSQRTMLTIGPALNDATLVDNYYHFAAFGYGHSTSLERVLNSQQVSDVYQYETAWWNRSHRFDSFAGMYGYTLHFKGPTEEDANVRYEASLRYANIACIGNLGTLRRFLDAALPIADNNSMFEKFYSVFRQMLNSRGKRQLETVYRGILGKILPVYDTRLHKAMLGLTRKRDMLVSEWADDDKLWPSSKEKHSVELM